MMSLAAESSDWGAKVNLTHFRDLSSYEASTSDQVERISSRREKKSQQRDEDRQVMRKNVKMEDESKNVMLTSDIRKQNHENVINVLKEKTEETESSETHVHTIETRLKKKNDEQHYDFSKEPILKSMSHKPAQERDSKSNFFEMKKNTNAQVNMNKMNKWTSKTIRENDKRMDKNDDTYDNGEGMLAVMDEVQVLKNNKNTSENKTQSDRRNTNGNKLKAEKNSNSPQIDKVVLDFNNMTVHDGIVLSVIHEVKGHVLFTRTFATWNRYTYSEDLVWWLSRLRPGRLVVMTIHKLGSLGLQKAWPTLCALGSIMAPYLPLQGLWVWVFVVQGRSLLESFSFTNYHQRPLFTLQVHTSFPLAPPRNLAPDDPMEAHRWSLCNRLVAMGSFCDPNNPMQLPSISNELPSQETPFSPDVIPVVVCAGVRIQYLVYTLEKLLRSRGMTSSRILVIVGTSFNTYLPNPDVIDLLTLLAIPHKVLAPLRGNFTGGVNRVLLHFYKSAMTEAVNHFSWAHQVAFLDEDVEVSEDWLEFLHYTSSLLHEDKTLYCVTSIGSIGGRDPTVLRRARLQPSWGFMVTKSFLEEALPLWEIKNNILLLYDMFLYEKVSRGRECLYPEVSRARHFGMGTNFDPYIHQKMYLDKKFHTGEPTPLTPLQHLTLETYDKELRFRLQAATPISREPCAPGFFPNVSAGDFVFYFHLMNLNDSYDFEWTVLAECVGLWPYSTQWMHQGVTELLSEKGFSILFVGVPASPFSDLHPRNYPIWTLYGRDLDFADQQWAFVMSLNPPPDSNIFTLENAYSHIFDINTSATEDSGPREYMQHYNTINHLTQSHIYATHQSGPQNVDSKQLSSQHDRIQNNPHPYFDHKQYHVLITEHIHHLSYRQIQLILSLSALLILLLFKRIVTNRSCLPVHR